MNVLVAEEFRRVLARRLVRVLALTGGMVVLAAGVIVFATTEQLSQSELRARRQVAAEKIDECLRGTGGSSAQGRPAGGSGRDQVCLAGRPSHVDDPRFKLKQLRGVLQVATAPLIVAAWLIGASMIGGDWQSRTLTTLLTWEPRRVRLLLAKAVASVAVASLFALAIQGTLGLALLPSLLFHGTTTGADASWPRSLVGIVLRGSGLAAIATSIGFAVASIGRSTATALGIGFAYFVIIENAIGTFLADFRRWLLLGNAIVFVSGRNGGGEVAGRSVIAAGMLLSAIAVGLTVCATVLFRLRDVR